MLRIVKHRDQSFEIDLHQNKPGRGSYVCKNTDCANMAWRVRGLNSSFHCRVPDEFYQKLIHFIEHHEFK